MKKLLCVLLSVLMLCAVLPVYAAGEDAAAETADSAVEADSDELANDAIEITDAASLAAIAEDPTAHYVLAADIDLAGVEWTPIPFAGTLDGAGHAIYNLSVTAVGEDSETTYDGNHKEYETYFAGLFSVVKDAVICDLTLRNARVNVTEEEKNCFAALLAGFCENAEISDCDLQGTVELHSGGVMVGVGGIAGFGIAAFQSDRVDAVLIHEAKSGETKCEEFAGGVLACGYCSVNDCEIGIQGYLSCHGYLHSGGIVGMHHQHNHAVEGDIPLTSSRNTVRGFIHYFEDNYDRRAYCEPHCGENLHWTMTLDDTNTYEFSKEETADYNTLLQPDTCGKGEYTEAVTEPTCTEWGFTTCTCSCGYSYTDLYTPPAHTPGEWEIVTPATLTEPGSKQILCEKCGEVLEEAVIAPHTPSEWEIVRETSYSGPGLRQQHCTDCGELLFEEEIPQLLYVSAISLSETDVTMDYKSTHPLSAVIYPADAYNQSVSWTSSDPSVVMVSSDGTLTALQRGSAQITCRSDDGACESVCSVEVGYSFSQWLIVICLFGWAWY